MPAASEFDPIFVHASMRSGSTYFFNVLRRNESLMCFNEAIMDGRTGHGLKDASKQNIAHLTRIKKWDMNHHFLEKADFQEFIEAWSAIESLYPKDLEYRDYLPPRGVLSAEFSKYFTALMAYARSQGKRPVFCEVCSRGRAGALRDAFGGFHIAQYRNPLSQFGSFIRGLIEGGVWFFLASPVTELGTSGTHPLYRIVPEPWRPPAIPWRAKSPAQRWRSDIEYIATVASSRPESLENSFRWHLFSWVLSNLAAISYSDLVLDIDQVYDDADYGVSIIDELAGKAKVGLDFSDVRKFDRYYDFESFDVAAVCDQVASTIRVALDDDRLADALRALGKGPLTHDPGKAVGLLLAKISDSLASMASSGNRDPMSNADWKVIAGKNRKFWFNPGVRHVAGYLYPVAAPVVWAARRAGISV